MHAFNGHHGATLAAYTFDAGPNAVIFVLQPHHAALAAFMLHFFPKVINGDTKLRLAAKVVGWVRGC